MPRRRNPELNAGDSGVELGPEPVAAPPAPPTLWVRKGYAIRHRVGGGRIPVVFAAVSALPEDAALRIKGKQAEIEAGREYVFEALDDPADCGTYEYDHPTTHFWIGHGAGAWTVKDVRAQMRR